MAFMKRALVTGASGFVGGHLVPYLYEQGLEIWASHHRRIKRFPFRIHWRRADLTRQSETSALVRESRPDYIFHLAAQAVPSVSWQERVATFEANTLASIYLLEAVVRWAPKARVILASTSHVYGRTFLKKKRPRETDLADPVSPYGGSKLLMELAALNFVRQNSVDVIIVRPFNWVGTGQNPSYVFYNFCCQLALMEAKKQPPVLKVGNIDVVRDFIHARDGARGYWLVAQKGKKWEIYNMGSGRGLLLRDAVQFLKKESRIPFKIKSEAGRKPKNDLPWIVSDPSKLKGLGWRPRESIREALREILDEQRSKAAH